MLYLPCDEKHLRDASVRTGEWSTFKIPEGSIFFCLPETIRAHLWLSHTGSENAQTCQCWHIWYHHPSRQEDCSNSRVGSSHQDLWLEKTEALSSAGLPHRNCPFCVLLRPQQPHWQTAGSWCKGSPHQHLVHIHSDMTRLHCRALGSRIDEAIPYTVPQTWTWWSSRTFFQAEVSVWKLLD